MNVTTTPPSSVNPLPVSTEFNLPQHKFEIDLNAFSDVSYAFVSLYENGGVYWFCLELVFPSYLGCTRQINSRGFVGLRNCTNSLRETLKSLGFRLSDTSALLTFVRNWENGLKTKKGAV